MTGMVVGGFCCRPVVHENVRVVKVPQEIPVDVYKEVPVPHYVDQYVDVPYQVPVMRQPRIIQPIVQNVSNECGSGSSSP